MGPEFVDALVEGRRDEAEDVLGAELPDGWPDRHDEGFLRLRLDQMRRDPTRQQWLVRAIVVPQAHAR
jgi:hypothetical protein